MESCLLVPYQDFFLYLDNLEIKDFNSGSPYKKRRPVNSILFLALLMYLFIMATEKLN